ncbi:MAG: hypothetical protein ABSF83_11490 [Nitrososphaerales archaeon]|jgi:hypothetical protein
MIAEILLSLAVSLLVRASPQPTPTGSSSSSSSFATVLNQLANEFNTAASQLLTVIDGTVIDVTRVAYVTVLLLGLFLYFTRVQRRLGRDLITGGIALAVLSEFVFPALVKV